MKKLLYIAAMFSFFFAACGSANQVATGRNAYDNGYTNNSNGYSRNNNGYNSNSNGYNSNSNGYNSNNTSYNNSLGSSINNDMFYSQLSPYGNWVSYPGYGSVWQPNSISGFRPYETGGHWVATVDGWAWASDYNWGWAPFHYGRWLLDPSIGWVWVPGNEWAPAWVTWGQYGNYYAWAPLSPEAGINGWYAPYNYWSFAPQNCIHHTNLSHDIVRPHITHTTVKNITIINNNNTYNNTQYNGGPKYEEVEVLIKQPIKPVAITLVNSPSTTKLNGNTLEVYQPEIRPIKNSSAGNNNTAIKTNNDDANSAQIKNTTIDKNVLQPQHTQPQNIQSTKPDNGVKDENNPVELQPVKHIKPATETNGQSVNAQTNPEINIRNTAPPKVPVKVQQPATSQPPKIVQQPNNVDVNKRTERQVEQVKPQRTLPLPSVQSKELQSNTNGNYQPGKPVAPRTPAKTISPQRVERIVAPKKQ